MGNFITSTRFETAFPVRHFLNRGGELSGATVGLEIRDASASDSYLDFSDGTFKAAASRVTPSLDVPEIVPGLHVIDGGIDWNSYTLPAGHYLDLEYTSTVAGLDWIDIDTVYFGAADEVWDEILSNNTHDINESAGKRLRQLEEAMVATDGTVSDVSPSPTAFDTDLGEVDGFWNDSMIVFIDGALNGQTRTVDSYVNASGRISFDEALTSAPGNGDAFLVLARHVHPITQIADGIWDEGRSGHTDVDSFGEFTGAEVMRGTDGANTTVPPSVAAIWAHLLPGGVSAEAQLDAIRDRIGNLSSENHRIRLAFADTEISTGRFVPALAVSHVEVYERDDAGAFPSEGSPSWFEEFTYKSGAVTGDSAASSDVSATEPTGSDYTIVPFPT
jgi:hypothetical protein